MPKRPSSAKRPRDPNQLGKLITGIATGEIKEENQAAGKDQAAVALRRKGGLKGGRQRAITLTQAERSEIAKLAAAARWKKK